VLGGLTIYPPVANFLQCIYAKNYENWLTADKVIAMKTVCSFLAHPIYSRWKKISLETWRMAGSSCYDRITSSQKQISLILTLCGQWKSTLFRTF